MGRAPCCEKVGLKRGRWTAEEDEILKNYIQANGEGSWRSLPKNAGLLRCGKSCRLRWINYLRADLKRGNISVEEEGTIIKLHASFGNRWSLIASHLHGRTDNEIKNYWNSHLSRKVYSFRGTNNTKDDNINLPRVLDTPPKRKGGRTSRWAMKKNKSYNVQNKIITDESPKQSVITHQNNNSNRISDNSEASSSTVHLQPTTPELECENLPTLVEDEFMFLDPETEEKTEREEQRQALVGSSSNNNSANIPKLQETHQSQVPAVEEGIGIEVGLLLETDKILGPYEEVIGGGGGGVLSFNDIIMDTGCIMGEASGVLNFGEGRDSNDDVVDVDVMFGYAVNNGESDTCTTADKVGKSSGELAESSVNNAAAEVYSCSSMASVLDDSGGGGGDWDWESVIQLNNEESSSVLWEQSSENLLTWLWQDDDDDWEKDFQRLGDIFDPEKQNAMVAWLNS